ncbi:hypothetical protein BT69DRAFT_1285082 [Atractiella rhizophila]|nr:hypothetical protein BT69DRAFT_1285082 [Atractiella rhizophila]
MVPPASIVHGGQHTSLSKLMFSALSAVAQTKPRTIGIAGEREGEGRRRASVAVIVRIRPSSPPPSPTVSTFYATPSGTTSRSRRESWSPSRRPVHLDPNPHPSIGDATHLLAPSASSSSLRSSVEEPLTDRLQKFFEQDWVKNGTPEIMYIKRATRSSDRWSSHLAFPGGRQEPDDESPMYTAMRETWEEVGIDLAEREFLHIGGLDDREITTSLGKRLLMVLSPFVFLQTSPESPHPDLQPSEVASAHWIPINFLTGPDVKWGDVVVDISSRLAPKSPFARSLLKWVVGSMKFKAILLPNNPIVSDHPSHSQRGDLELKLWGLTLGMTLDLFFANGMYHNLSPATYPFYISAPSSQNEYDYEKVHMRTLPPIMEASMTSIFPKFSHPDVNALIWLFGWRYRSLVRSWSIRMKADREEKIKRSQSQDRIESAVAVTGDSRVNWAGMALGSFYSSVRKALIAAIVLRSTVILGGFATVIWWIKRRKQRRLA